jgi:hypothetical protein
MGNLRLIRSRLLNNNLPQYQFLKKTCYETEHKKNTKSAVKIVCKASRARLNFIFLRFLRG